MTTMFCVKPGTVMPPTRKSWSSTTAYKRWYNMIQRCTKPKNAKFKDYGARGITVCERWLTFENFFADMGEPPPGLLLDREDNDKGYDKDNCRWVTPAVSVANRRPLNRKETK